MIKNEVGLELLPSSECHKIIILATDWTEIKKVCFTSDDVYSKLKRILTENKFRENMQKMKVLA